MKRYAGNIIGGLISVLLPKLIERIKKARQKRKMRGILKRRKQLKKLNLPK